MGLQNGIQCGAGLHAAGNVMTLVEVLGYFLQHQIWQVQQEQLLQQRCWLDRCRFKDWLTLERLAQSFLGTRKRCSRKLPLDRGFNGSPSEMRDPPYYEGNYYILHITWLTLASCLPVLVPSSVSLASIHGVYSKLGSNDLKVKRTRNSDKYGSLVRFTTVIKCNGSLNFQYQECLSKREYATC